METAFGKRLDRVRQASPLVHCISNLVTANDCANIVLAAGASPIMADAPEEVREITALSRALCSWRGARPLSWVCPWFLTPWAWARPRTGKRSPKSFCRTFP